MNNAIKILAVCFMFALGTTSYADVVLAPAKVAGEVNIADTDIVSKDNFVKAKYASAENRFIQNNVRAAYDDFSSLIDITRHDDYVFMLYGLKMAEYGFFDLSNALIDKLDNNHFTAAYVKDMKRFYYPSGFISNKDIMFFADAYSNIVYNDMALETTTELMNAHQIEDCDYKNYLIALGYYKSNNLPLALKYINLSLKENDTNINYLGLKAKILADAKKSSQALNVVEQINKTEFLTLEFQKKAKAIEEYVLYKTEKSEAVKDYHLAYYYHLMDKSYLATKVLHAALLTTKQHNKEIFSLLGKIYYENNEIDKAEDFASRAFRENKRDYMSLLTLAEINYEKGRLETALEYFKKAKKAEKKALSPQIGIAKTYLAMNQDEKTKKIYEKLLKKNLFNEELLIESLKVIPQRVDYYLPRAAGIDVSNNDLWLGLANHAIKDGNISMATTYLNNSYYIDENNFKYYYYLSLVQRAKGDIELANQSLMKCSNINANYANLLNNGK